MFEGALLDRHLNRCADCRAFAVSAAAGTELLRGASLERLERSVVVPGRRSPVRRVAAGAVTTLAAVAAAAVFTLTPSGQNAGSPALSAARAQVGAPVLVVVPAQPSPGSKETVPRLEMQPASIADGPVHGLYSRPIKV